MKIKEIFLILLMAFAVISASYGVYWVSKKLSYDWWYRPMVEQTIREMVKPEYLND